MCVKNIFHQLPQVLILHYEVRNVGYWVSLRQPNLGILKKPLSIMEEVIV